MAAETQFSGNTGLVTISTANSNLNGSGTLASVVTAAAAGTLIKSVSIKAQGNTTLGMIRFFIYNGTTSFLISEIEVPPVTQAPVDRSFECRMEINFALAAGWVLKVSTQNAEAFNIIAECTDWTYYTSAVREASTRYSPSSTIYGVVSTANSNLDGTGTLVDIYTAGAVLGGAGLIRSILVKGQGNTTDGMIRLFLFNGTTSFLLTEIPVVATTQSASVKSFSSVIDFNGKGLALASGIHLKASTQNAETFNVIVEGLDWMYPS
jgi:hypothetical protein